MRLYYTISSGANNEQPTVSSSLGGFCSSTPVMNDEFGNLFDEVSVMTIRTGRDEYRALVLRNEDSVTHRNIKVSVTPASEGSICSYKMAIVQMTDADKYGNKKMESIRSPYSRPFNAQFTDMVEGASVVIGELKPNEQVGIWICRHIDAEAARKQYHDVAEPDPTDPTGRRYRPITHVKEESFNFVFEW